MTKAEVADRMQRIFDNQIMATREAGQKEYAGGEDCAFGNFERLAADLDLDREKILWVYAMKHRDGIASYLNGHTSQREDVTGRIQDLIVYLFLLWCMIEEGREKEDSAARERANQIYGNSLQEQMQNFYPFGVGLGV